MPLSSPALPSSSGIGTAQSNSYASSPLSLFRLQEQFRQHMAATNNLMHYPAFDMTQPSTLPYLNMTSPLGTLPCQSYYQSLSQAQQMWSSPLLQASGGLPALNSKTTSIENLRLRAKQHAASLGLDTLPNWPRTCGNARICAIAVVEKHCVWTSCVWDLHHTGVDITAGWTGALLYTVAWTIGDVWTISCDCCDKKKH